ncbi:MAG: S8 family serine peptidase [Saprospirales bacterium]|nr:S8 family serine peptidase [Saprospirales bacterium]
MYKVKYGGKKGKTIELVESPDMVAIRTKGNQNIEKVSLSRSSRAIIDETKEVAAFPEAGISVRKVAAEGDLESTGGTRERDAARATLKQEENIRFAGRVLQDAGSGEVMLYTENFFVKFTDATPEKDCLALLEKYQLKVKSKLAFAVNAYFVEASEGTGLEVFNIAEKLLEEKQVEYCHPELVQERRFKGVHPLQWHLAKTAINGQPVNAHINIEKAWGITKGKGVTIAIIDDGVDQTHPEFASRIVHPFDATQNSADPNPKMDDDNHGTACAGVACAAGLPGGASGTAPEATLMPIRLRSGLGSMAEANAFVWAADHGADVISCSWGPTDGEWWNPMDATHNRLTALPDSTRLAMDYVLKKGRGGKGSVILFAAGNGNEDTKNDGYASYPGVIAVAACNDTGKRCVYSDYGKAIWVSFPSADYGWKNFQHPAPLSEGLRTTDRQGQAGYTAENYVNSFGGTSAACPGMAGIVALLLAANPQLRQAEIKDLLRQSCVRIDEKGGEYDAQGHSIWYGYGRIDAGLAVENALKAAARQPESLAATAIEGAVKFHSGDEIPLQPGLLMGADYNPPKRVLGLRLQLKAAPKDLKLRYQVNISSSGIAQNNTDGEYVGAIRASHRILGFAIHLEGPDAGKYELAYSARLKGRKTLATAKNGAWCGTDKKTGKTVEAVSVTLKNRRPSP